MPEIRVLGPIDDVLVLRAELLAEVAAGDGELVAIGEVHEKRPSLFENGRLGSSPLAEFFISYGSEMATAGSVALARLVYLKVRHKPQLKIDPPEADQGGDEETEPK